MQNPGVIYALFFLSDSRHHSYLIGLVGLGFYFTVKQGDPHLLSQGVERSIRGSVFLPSELISGAGWGEVMRERGNELDLLLLLFLLSITNSS